MLENFMLAESDGEVIGLVGLQVFDTIGLLRSLVVAKNARSSGLGGKLVGAIEAAAQTAGIDELWLLTIDAEKFFSRHGYEFAARKDAPDSIRQTDEFRELCPDNAHLMYKSVR
jgi:amino-acid N-acetyltransferase